MTTRPFNPETFDIKVFKQIAYDRRKTTGEVHGHILNELAREYGFNTYAALRAALPWEKRK